MLVYREKFDGYGNNIVSKPAVGNSADFVVRFMAYFDYNRHLYQADILYSDSMAADF